jgi:hypothetical protein
MSDNRREAFEYTLSGRLAAFCPNNKHMLVSVIAILIGCLMIVGNGNIGRMTGTVQRGQFSDLSTSVAPQNIAIIGGVLIVVGFAGFIFL